MALIVETGSGAANSESYISVADADTYFANRGITLWATMTETEKEWSLRRATDYMVQAYRKRWAGDRVTSTQALDWPRDDVPVVDVPGEVYSSTAVPNEVVRACAELAFRGAHGELLADEERETISEKVDAIAVTYQAGASKQVRYAAVDALLNPFFRSGGTSRVLVSRS